MDSKSKLQSKNPNKIQTTKIQGSKTSKDSMKLESSPQLDSKTSQKSNSKSKSPKIQKAKTCDSKKPAKSKNSSKLKSFIRTIPISIALASALSSQAVAAWTTREGDHDFISSGGGLVNNVGQNVTINAGTIVLNTGNAQKGGTAFMVNSNDTAGNFTISSGATITTAHLGAINTGIFFFGQNSNAGIFTNNGVVSAAVSQGQMFSIDRRASVEAIINTGIFQHTGGMQQVIGIWEGANVGLFRNTGTITSTTRAIHMKQGTISNFQIDGGLLKSNARAINMENAAKIENFTITNGGSIRGDINLANTSNIGTMIISGANNSGTATQITGNISLNGSSRISKILIDGSNSSGTNGTPKLDGDITLNTSNRITNGITIANGGTLDGHINARNSSSIGGIAINNGSLAGNISLTNNARIQGGIVLDSANMTGSISLSTANGGGNITIDSINIGSGSTMTGDISVLGNSKITDTITIDGTLDGNVKAAWGNADYSGTINQMDISGEITKKVQLDNKAKISILNLNGGTITEGIAFQGTITNSETSTIDTLTLSGAAHIGSIDIGNTTSGSQAKGVISNLTLNGASSIGTITNNSNGTITNIALNGTSTITNGITNNSGGTISNITLASSNTINNGITNNSGGNIGAIISNTGTNINNMITNHGTIGSLEVNNQGTIVYRSDNGII
uniref:beta strand repeat-containing protein n=1 Tax=Helicobacter pullorum TaxID=35818 RepID=UPI0010657B11